MKHLLFVDDDANVLAGLKRMLRAMRQEWRMLFVNSGKEALAVLEETPMDIIVSDMKMPRMDGAELLMIIKEKWPDTVRIILSGYTDPEMALRSVTAAHQFLPKPCDDQILVATLSRSCSLSNLLKNKRLKSLVAGMTSLPSLPNLYMEILALLKSEAASVQKIGEVLSRDISMTAKILQLINSAFFGFPRQISHVTDAVSLLGVDMVKALTLSIQVFSQFDQMVLKRLNLETIWSHSMNTGRLARKIALDAGAGKYCADQALLAGNLHDLGKIILAVNFPEKYSVFNGLAPQGKMSGLELEQDIFDAGHPEVGAYLLGLWGLPDDIIEAVAYHHHPGITKTEKFTPVVAVHVANALENECRNATAPASTVLDIGFLQSLEGGAFAGCLKRWRDIAVAAMQD
jgi:putative nucleotidyltransferase with HDIG domain